MQGEYTQVNNPETLARALECARGRYQRNVILGFESLSGSTLKGKARTYSGRYYHSRKALLARLSSRGITCIEIRADHGKRVLVLE